MVLTKHFLMTELMPPGPSRARVFYQVWRIIINNSTLETKFEKRRATSIPVNVCHITVLNIGYTHIHKLLEKREVKHFHWQFFIKHSQRLKRNSLVLEDSNLYFKKLPKSIKKISSKDWLCKECSLSPATLFLISIKHLDLRRVDFFGVKLVWEFRWNWDVFGLLVSGNF